MTATSLCMDFTFKHISLPSSILAAKDKLYLEKKRPQPKGRKMTLVLHNEIYEVLAFLFQNFEKWDEGNIDRPEFMNDCLILFTNSHIEVTAHYQILISSVGIKRNLENGVL